jgi:hypothetical protein
MISSNAPRAFSSESPIEQAEDAHRLAPVWNGFLHEFRNHLTVLMAATSELRAELPPALALQVGDAVFQTERNVQGLTALVALVDASMRTVEPVIAPLGGIVDRAVRLATPAVGSRAVITTDVPRDAGVKNRGSALEGLLAALIVDLARSHGGGDGAELGRSPRVHVSADVGRRGLTIEIACEGARFSSTSWRYALATEIAAKLDADLVQADEASAYVVQLR